MRVVADFSVRLCVYHADCHFLRDFPECHFPRGAVFPRGHALGLRYHAHVEEGLKVFFHFLYGLVLVGKPA